MIMTGDKRHLVVASGWSVDDLSRSPVWLHLRINDKTPDHTEMERRLDTPPDDTNSLLLASVTMDMTNSLELATVTMAMKKECARRLEHSLHVCSCIFFFKTYIFN